ncbi:hypothetical protein ABK040_011933 [Willaertia magna]
MLKFFKPLNAPKSSVQWEDDTSIEKAMYQALKDSFKLEEFRPQQYDIIFNLLKNKKDTFVLLPTGGGKSLCYQLPAVLYSGVTLVVSPLIALMHNQVVALHKNKIKANFWNSSQKKSEIDGIQKDLESGQPKLKLLYVTPELIIGNEKFKGLMKLLASRDQLSLIAIDESHCISEWGHDFRPSFRKLHTLKKEFPQTPIIALTATATDKVRTDVIEQLDLKNPSLFISSFNRPNIFYEIRYKDLIDDPLKDLINFLKTKEKDCGIIYCRTRNQVDELVNLLKEENFSVKPYHAGVKLSERKSVQLEWLEGKTKIIVATIAFGMGIDKKDVRFVVHYSLPKSLEGFYQESGRAGRDGKNSISILYHDGREKNSIEFLISKERRANADRIKSLENGFQKVCELCETPICRRKFILSFFGEKYEGKPSNQKKVGNSKIRVEEIAEKCCDYCIDPKGRTEIIKNATYTYGRGSVGGTTKSDELMLSLNDLVNDDIEEYDDVDEFDGDELIQFRQEEERNKDSFLNQLRKQRGITNSSLITRKQPINVSKGNINQLIGGSSGVFKSSVQKNAMLGNSNLTEEKKKQQEELKRKRMEDKIDNLFEALENEERRDRKFVKPTSSKPSSLLPKNSQQETTPTFQTASSLMKSSTYRVNEMNQRKKTKQTKTKPVQSNLMDNYLKK